ncbi:glycoprotein Xg [Cebus imitator]|uniref:glycoprotein Xg n=1 Tax=Cebus imitator TaxID=2715852 RepID=UPI001899390B|nr:glycoprotein Xg [Cebus imitator]
MSHKDGNVLISAADTFIRLTAFGSGTRGILAFPSWCGLTPCLLPIGQRDFDLADALDDPEPTKKPNSGYFNDGDRNDGHYPPRPRPPAGGDYHVGHDSLEGNMVAKIVSPIVSVVVVTLLGAAASYFKLNNRRNCFRTHEPENV